MRTGSININSRFGYSNRNSNRYYNSGINRGNQTQKLEEQKKRRNKELALTGLGLVALGVLALICKKTSAARKLINEAAENAGSNNKSGWLSNLLKKFRKGAQQGATEGAEAAQESAEKSGWFSGFFKKFKKGAQQGATEGAEAAQESAEKSNPISNFFKKFRKKAQSAGAEEGSERLSFEERLRERHADTFERSSGEIPSDNQPKKKSLLKKIKERFARKDKVIDPNRKLTQDEVDDLIEGSRPTTVPTPTVPSAPTVPSVPTPPTPSRATVPPTPTVVSTPTTASAPSVPTPTSGNTPVVIGDDVVPIGPFPIDESSMDPAQLAYNKVMQEAQEKLNNDILIRQQAQETTRQALEGKEILSQSEIDAIVNRETKRINHEKMVEEAKRTGGDIPWYPKEVYTKKELEWQRFGEDYKRASVNWEKSGAEFEMEYAFKKMDQASMDAAHLKALQAAEEATLEAQRGKNVLSQTEIDKLIESATQAPSGAPLPNPLTGAASQASRFTHEEVKAAMNKPFNPLKLQGYSTEEIEEMLARSADPNKTLQENLELLTQQVQKNTQAAERAGAAADDALATAFRKQQELLGEAGLSAGSIRPESDDNAARKAADDIMNTLLQITLGGKINKAQFIEELFSSEYVTKYCQPHPYFVEEFEKLKPETIAALTHKLGFEDVLMNVKDEQSAQEIIKALQEFQKKIPARHLKKYAYDAHNMNNKAYHKVVDAINEIIEMSRR